MVVTGKVNLEGVRTRLNCLCVSNCLYKVVSLSLKILDSSIKLIKESKSSVDLSNSVAVKIVKCVYIVVLNVLCVNKVTEVSDISRSAFANPLVVSSYSSLYSSSVVKRNLSRNCCVYDCICVIVFGTNVL